GPRWVRATPRLVRAGRGACRASTITVPSEHERTPERLKGRWRPGAIRPQTVERGPGRWRPSHAGTTPNARCTRTNKNEKSPLPHGRRLLAQLDRGDQR